MDSHPFDVEASLSQHGAALRRLAASLLGGEAAADDAVQETWLRALQRPPATAASPSGWFATVLRNVVRRQRRGERRRSERQAAAARPEAVEDAARALMRQEQAQRLLAAVGALEEPFREAIWQRYFEGLPPRRIAQAAVVPLATVKSRLQRALQQLRARLGDGEAGDWRRAMALAFGWRPGSGIAAAAAAAGFGQGVLGMTLTSKATVAALAAAVAAGLWWWTAAPTVSPAPPPTAADGPAAAVAAADAPAKPLAAERLLDAAPAPAARAASGQPSPPSPRATLRGRCVDAAGSPLAGCHVRLDAAVRIELAKAWLDQHAEMPDWTALAPQVTGSDGTFAFGFSPPPPMYFELTAGHAGLVPVRCSWPSIAAGAALDCGDLVLAAGILVSGRVVDQDGAPVGRSVLHVRPWDEVVPERAPAGVARADGAADCVSAPTGEFTLRGPLPAGDYRLRIEDREVVQPVPMRLLASASTPVEIVVKTVPPGMCISGRVLDGEGNGVSGMVLAGSKATLCLDGYFRLQRESRTPDEPVRLRVLGTGFEPPPPSAPIAWGTHDVVLRVARPQPLRLLVVDADLQPVTDYRVEVTAKLPIGGEATLANGRAAEGPFADGVATLPGVGAGAWIARVGFPPGSPFVRLVAKFELAHGAPRSLTLHAQRTAVRRLVVRYRDGTPVVGSSAQLCETFGRPFDEATRVLAEARWQWNAWSPTAALLLQQTTTAADGSCLLQGAPQRDLSLRIEGDDHREVLLPQLRLDEPGDLVVTVDRGARLVGRVLPAGALDELKSLVGVEVDAPFPAAERPSLRLSARGRLVPPLARGDEVGGVRRFTVGDDGRFDIGGLPPGSWELEFVYHRGSGTHGMALQQVMLAEAETLQLDVDVTRLLPGRLEATVLLDGAPLADGTAWLHRVDGPGEGAVAAPTDAAGRCTFLCPPGDYRLQVRTKDQRRQLVAAPTVAIRRGATARQVFAIATGAVALRLLDADGRPVAGVEVVAVPGDGSLPPTDADGRTGGELPAQLCELRVLPRRLQDPAARQALAQPAGSRAERDPFAAHWLRLGSVAVQAGQETAVELRLPSGW